MSNQTGFQLSMHNSDLIDYYFWRIFRKIRRKILAFVFRARDYCFSTYSEASNTTKVPAQIFSFIDAKFVNCLAKEFPQYPDLVRQQAAQSIDHSFDLLGSGLVNIRHGMRCKGFEGFNYSTHTAVVPERSGEWLKKIINSANIQISRHIWSQLEGDYEPIDWQLDFKSGYRWKEKTWFGGIHFGSLLGVDIKVPWELSRMQHLPTLAIAYQFAAQNHSSFEKPLIYMREFRNQILDFLATNPPSYGVNWSCPMDVAIRVANMLVARDIIIAGGAELDDEFESIFFASVKAHARHIIRNLEWAPKVRGNHYLANIVGLLFVSIFIPCDDEVDSWLIFSVHELISEVDYQFHDDGSNFEGSVCYHRLSSEMVLWASALLSNLSSLKRNALMRNDLSFPRSVPFHKKYKIKFYYSSLLLRETPLPCWFWQRLAKMRDFTVALTRPDNHVVQFGDNDSGRFITLGSGEQIRALNNPDSVYWSLDHRSLIEGIGELINCDEDIISKSLEPSAQFIRAISGKSRNLNIINDRTNNQKNVNIPNFNRNTLALADDKIWFKTFEEFKATAPGCRWISVFDAAQSGILNKIAFASFPGMGCYIVRGAQLYLAIRCGELGLGGLGAHSHCDQLAIELVIDGISRVRDPGSYIYTPLPGKRNIYRSASVHHVPRVLHKEPANLSRGVFNLSDGPEGESLYFGPRGFIGRHNGYGSWVYRIISLHNSRIMIFDFSQNNLPIINPSPVLISFSQGYGRIMEGI